MTASSAPSGRPPSTAIAWATKDALFVEIPCRDGPPYITRYPRTADGLAKALNVLVKNESKGGTTILREHPKIAKNVKAFSEDQRERARAALKKVGIT